MCDVTRSYVSRDSIDRWATRHWIVLISVMCLIRMCDVTRLTGGGGHCAAWHWSVLISVMCLICECDSIERWGWPMSYIALD